MQSFANLTGCSCITGFLVIFLVRGGTKVGSSGVVRDFKLLLTDTVCCFFWLDIIKEENNCRPIELKSIRSEYLLSVKVLTMIDLISALDKWRDANAV